MLLSLPTEVVDRIAWFIDGRSLLNLRLSCHQLNKETFATFATSFFDSVVTDLCPKSLRRLQCIAEDDRFRPYVRKVTFGRLDGRCPNPPRHGPGTGFFWIRDSSLCLDPAQQLASELRKTFSLLINCEIIVVNIDLAPSHEPEEPPETSLCLMDVVHLALLGAASAPSVKTFRFNRTKLFPGFTHSLLPSDPSEWLGSSWSDHITELQLEWYTQHDPQSLSVFLDVALSAKSLQKLSVSCIPPLFFRLFTETSVVPPIRVLNFDLVQDLSADELIAFTSCFENTLEHVFFNDVALTREVSAAAELNCVCLHWSRSLLRLESFGVQSLPSGNSLSKITFNAVLHWDDPPKAGELQFVCSNRGPNKDGVIGIGYKGNPSDVRKVLVKVGESAVDRLSSPNNQLETTEPGDILIGGKLLARHVRHVVVPARPS